MLKTFIRKIKYKFKFQDSIIYDGVYIDNKSTLGYKTVVFKNVTIINSSIDSFTYIQSNSTILNCSIGKYCSFGSNIYIGLASHPTSLISTNPVFYDNTQSLPLSFVNSNNYPNNIPITNIGHDVWIGNNVLIKSGVTIGTGAIIGAGSVVTKDILPYTVCVGIPCREIKKRFDNMTIDLLLKSNWFNNDYRKIIKLSNYFENPIKFIELLNENNE